MLTQWQLIDRGSRRLVVERLELADGFWSRLVGLQFRKSLAPADALLLVPCRSVHTCWLRFPVDIVAIDRRATVLAVRSDVRPWRAVWLPRGTWAVLEFPAQAARLDPGDTIVAESLEHAAHLPASLGFLQAEEKYPAS